MRKILFILVLVLGIGGVSVAQTAQTQPSKEYVAALKKMIVVSGSDATFKLVIPQMFAMMKQQLPNVPAEFWSEAEKEMMKTLVDDLVELLAPIYHMLLLCPIYRKLRNFTNLLSVKKWLPHNRQSLLKVWLSDSNGV